MNICPWPVVPATLNRLANRKSLDLNLDTGPQPMLAPANQPLHQPQLKQPNRQPLRLICISQKGKTIRCDERTTHPRSPYGNPPTSDPSAPHPLPPGVS
ncbi:hypothetical protein PGT21_007601 [Puccinia graminis f. sp. tritici]|uniref:Uncharacterized protein n=1 Tax=Puccinia graminis f. sp. tritici TaxID=56615 RepID=A0A5B0S7S2_PUCGR|nr:hypothetical protein PGT21_007601 [Puccinia graminis f. sp. tritici]KAA1133519.1 hypothetical protein PGTUg99_021315 [Puccinia graminis f. sp. tritici]